MSDETTDTSSSQHLSSSPPAPAAIAAHAPNEAIEFAPLPEGSGVVSMLLRRPGRIVYQLHQRHGTNRLGAALGAIAMAGLFSYGLVVGGFSGAEQLWLAPLKITVGALLTAAICLPSLYVLVCLGGANDQLGIGALSGLLFASGALNALLLVSFAPIAWVFSQSTESVAFISTLHLIFWAVGLYFGLRFLKLGAEFIGVSHRGYLLLWMMIFVFVNLQMMTALRPIVGRSDQLLPTEKQFFLVHWSKLFTQPN